MNKFSDPNNLNLRRGDNVRDYMVKRVVPLEGIRSYFYELEHSKTGARHIHISNKDAENTFSVAFKTVPVDSTGVAHILEHTVLCGSSRYPVRDPFFSMLKRSLSTFMNAFTASDWTMYPFSTQNRKDYFNLMDVYLDAAFFPKLEELSFMQEGHRLEIEGDLDDDLDRLRLIYKGVVYNEMKGAMSSPDQVMVRTIQKMLYPSTTYHYNSGGDPAEIPSLSYVQLKEFHRRHYHPSNAFFYTYGNLPLAESLAVIEDTVLNKFSRTTPDTEVASQPRWDKPREEVFPYPFQSNEEDPSKKCQACVAWLAADIKDTFEILALSLLEQILLGNSASPLRKALIDSGLGSALCDGSGFDADNRDTLFVFGLKDVEEAAAEKIETLIFQTLNDLVDKGIDRQLIESAIHQIEFHRKEITNTPYPYGIKLLMAFAGTWMHGGDPVRILKFDDDLKKLREAMNEEPFFENLIRKWLLTNSHRSRLTMVPDEKMEQNEANRVRAELEKIKKNLSLNRLKQIRQNSEALKLQQETPVDVSCLPTLEREDIPPSVPAVKETEYDRKSCATLYSQPTSGIFYFSASAGTGVLPRELIPLAPFFCYALTRCGTALHDYTAMARQIDAYTGGICLATHARTRYGDVGSCLPFISFGGKCLVRNQDKMFNIIEELIAHFDFGDHSRLKNLLNEYRAGLQSMIVHNGHRLAISAASRNFSPARALSESWSGIHQLKTIKQITDELTDKKLAALSEDLSALGAHLFARNNFQMALIGEEDALSRARGAAAAIFDQLADGQPDGFGPPKIQVDKESLREGWSTSSAVSFVALTFETVRMTHADAPALSVISKILRSMYLHREIREKGGAYGGFAIYSPEDGLFGFGSYRDPHIVATLNVYAAAADFIRSGSYSDEDVKEAILQVCSEIDKPDPPGPAARKAFYRKIVSLSDEIRNQFKTRLLSLTRNDVRQAAAKYFDTQAGRQAVAVISNEQKLNEANQELADQPLKLYQI
ncbi:MAG: insulinase family protein [Desulfobacterales bacterium]|nr:insulinase family protein [Desulfobacterales bacterium]